MEALQEMDELEEQEDKDSKEVEEEKDKDVHGFTLIATFFEKNAIHDEHSEKNEMLLKRIADYNPGLRIFNPEHQELEVSISFYFPPSTKVVHTTTLKPGDNLVIFPFVMLFSSSENVKYRISTTDEGERGEQLVENLIVKPVFGVVNNPYLPELINFLLSSLKKLENTHKRGLQERKQ